MIDILSYNYSVIIIYFEIIFINLGKYFNKFI
jgi:hypothetical protein